MAKANEETAVLNIHQKLLKIANMAGVLQKNKEAFSYNYVTEDAIQAKVTAGMQKYGLMLYAEIIPGTLRVESLTYTKYDKKLKQDKAIHEILAVAETKYTWVNVDNPEEKIEIPWVAVGQMEDAAQAFGAAMTYSNRYFLMKTLQLATTEDDPDEYRSRQRQAEKFEDEEAAKRDAEMLKAAKKEVTDYGTKLIKAGIKKDDIYKIVGQFNGGEENPSSIKDLETCNLVMEAFKKLEK